MLPLHLLRLPPILFHVLFVLIDVLRIPPLLRQHHRVHLEVLTFCMLRKTVDKVPEGHADHHYEPHEENGCRRVDITLCRQVDHRLDHYE